MVGKYNIVIPMDL